MLFGVGSPNALLLVKDFNTHEPLKFSDKFMSNADVVNLACASSNVCDMPDPRNDEVQNNRVLTYTTESHSDLSNGKFITYE